jgi:hypothetical protein
MISVFISIYGKQLSSAFRHLGVTNFLDINEFILSRKYYPEIGFIWFFGQGGSYTFRDNQLGSIVIHNGTFECW